MITKKVSTKFDGKVWLHEKYLRKAIANGESLLIVFDGKEMTVTPEDIKTKRRRFVKGDTEHENKWGPGSYYLYGTEFIPDQGDLFDTMGV